MKAFFDQNYPNAKNLVDLHITLLFQRKPLLYPQPVQMDGSLRPTTKWCELDRCIPASFKNYEKHKTP